MSNYIVLQTVLIHVIYSFLQKYLLCSAGLMSFISSGYNSECELELRMRGSGDCQYKFKTLRRGVSCFVCIKV